MKKYLIISLSVLFVITFFVVSCFAAPGMTKVTILPQGLIIGTPANINLSVTPGNDIEQNFSSPFWIEDLRGISQGHYTTIQCNGLYQDGGDGVITGVQLSRGTGYFLIAGRTNGTTMNPELSGYTDITTPKLFFYRNDGENNGGVLNRYGVLPYIKVSVPSGTPAGTYKGKITYTLYDMGFSH